MSKLEVDRYIAALDEPKRSTLESLRQTIAGLIPQAEQVISYGMPGFRLNGRMIAGFAAFKNHLAYLPHSGSVISALPKELAGYASTSGSLHFPIDTPLPRSLVKKLIDVRLKQIRDGAQPAIQQAHKSKEA